MSATTVSTVRVRDNARLRAAERRVARERCDKALAEWNQLATESERQAPLLDTIGVTFADDLERHDPSRMDRAALDAYAQRIREFTAQRRRAVHDALARARDIGVRTAARDQSIAGTNAARATGRSRPDTAAVLAAQRASRIDRQVAAALSGLVSTDSSDWDDAQLAGTAARAAAATDPDGAIEQLANRISLLNERAVLRREIDRSIDTLRTLGSAPEAATLIDVLTLHRACPDARDATPLLTRVATTAERLRSDANRAYAVDVIIEELQRMGFRVTPVSNCADRWRIDSAGWHSSRNEARQFVTGVFDTNSSRWRFDVQHPALAVPRAEIAALERDWCGAQIRLAAATSDRGLDWISDRSAYRPPVGAAMTLPAAATTSSTPRAEPARRGTTSTTAIQAKETSR